MDPVTQRIERVTDLSDGWERSEAIGRVDAVRAWFANERVVEAQRARIQILLVERIGEVLPVRKVLDPRCNGVAPLAGALEKQPRVADAVPALSIALGVEGVEK